MFVKPFVVRRKTISPFLISIIWAQEESDLSVNCWKQGSDSVLLR
jgi:hypothetical protein